MSSSIVKLKDPCGGSSVVTLSFSTEELLFLTLEPAGDVDAFLKSHTNIKAIPPRLGLKKAYWKKK